MSLSREDKGDVKGALGKAMANKISKVTRDNNGTRRVPIKSLTPGTYHSNRSDTTTKRGITKVKIDSRPKYM